MKQLTKSQENLQSKNNIQIWLLPTLLFQSLLNFVKSGCYSHQEVYHILPVLNLYPQIPKLLSIYLTFLRELNKYQASFVTFLPKFKIKISLITNSAIASFTEFLRF